MKETTPAALAALRQDGVRVVMLTGDNRTTAEAVGRYLGIDEVDAEVLPDRKAAVVERLRGEGRIVAMAGDGVNDAPALAAADVGIAMGTGTDVAIESAHVTLLKGDLMGIVRARRLSAATMRNIRQNLFFAFIYNAAGVPIAAGLLYPIFGVLLSPAIAAARDGALVGERGRERAAVAQSRYLNLNRRHGRAQPVEDGRKRPSARHLRLCSTVDAKTWMSATGADMTSEELLNRRGAAPARRRQAILPPRRPIDHRELLDHRAVLAAIGDRAH